MPDNKYTIDDMLSATLEQRPSDFENAFDDVVTDLIRDRIEAQKVQIAQQMYGYEPPEPPEEDFEEPEEGSEDDVEVEDEVEYDDEEVETDSTQEEEDGEVS